MYSFENVIGNEKNIKYLRGLINRDRIGNAYIFNAMSGGGKKLLAYAFAKAMLCQDNTGCDVCSSCKSFESKNNPDVIYVTPSKSILSVDEIREQINKSVSVKPYLSKYKIYIVQNADKMNIAAQNALLKTLEEPPDYVVIILLASNINVFLRTILSRAVVLKIAPIPEDMIQLHLNKLGVMEAGIASVFSMGSIGRALNIAENQEFITNMNKVIEIAISIKNCDLVQLFGTYKQWESMKDSISECLDILYIWYRDILVLLTLDPDVGKTLIQNENLKFETENYTIKGIINILQEIQKTKRNISLNANFQLSMEMLMIKLKENTGVDKK